MTTPQLDLVQTPIVSVAERLLASISACLFAMMMGGCTEKPPDQLASAVAVDKARKGAAAEVGVTNGFKVIADLSTNIYTLHRPPEERTFESAVPRFGTYIREDRVYVYEYTFKMVSNEYDFEHRELAGKEMTLTARVGFRRCRLKASGKTFVHWEVFDEVEGNLKK